MQLSPLDIAVFLCYFVGLVVFALSISARSKTKSSSDYFLASKKLPWYAVGASFIAANISTEHFIGMVGWGFLYGMSVSHWAWGNFATFSVLIWIFLPFYMRGNVSTMPEWLERRYNSACRYIYAAVQIIGLVIALLGGVLLAGATAITVFFPQIEPSLAILLLAAAAGTYTIYGGLLAAAWADLVQYILLMVGGLVVSYLSISKAGGIARLSEEMPERFIMFFPSTHEMVPWTGMILAFFSVGIWYSCANQFMVQRCLGARSEWDARMGIVMAGFSQALLPLLVVVPGVVAFYLFQDRISDGDQSWPFLAMQFLPVGARGLVLAGLASAILSTLSAIVTSSSTIFTLDLYKSILRPHASDKQLLRVGRLSGAVILLIGVAVALLLAQKPEITIFALIQTIFFYMAPPIAAVFLVGILWRGATPAGATATLVLGFLVYLPLTVMALFPNPWATGLWPSLASLNILALAPYNSFMHHTFVVFLFCVVTELVISMFTQRRTDSELKTVVWTTEALGVPSDQRRHYRGFRSLTLWWGIMAALLVSLYLATHWQGSRTAWLEAESLPFETASAADARVQARAEVAQKERFKLWTGAGQVLFQPRRAGDRIIFDLPVEAGGTYRLDALVTSGFDYGSFRATVSERRAKLTYNDVTVQPSGEVDIERRSVDVFDAHRGRSLTKPTEASASLARNLHFVRRIGLGNFALRQGVVRVAVIVEDWRADRARIGIDSWLLTRVED